MFILLNPIFENGTITKMYRHDNQGTPTLYDQVRELHEMQNQINVAKDYRAVCTPDIFGFNKNLQLKYRGRIDSKVVEEDNNDIKREMYEAMKLIKETNEGPLNQFNSFGCSIKWANNE